MTQFYVPEISDRFTLVSDWGFTLHYERRNRTMIELLGLNDDEAMVAARERAAGLRGLAYREVWKEVPGQRWGLLSVPPSRYRDHEIKDPVALQELRELQAKLNSWPLQASLPAGTELQVDRIYIRKGLKDFSSITFYVVSSPKPELNASKKSKRRFWAKLSDCNRMEIERSVEPELALAS